MARALRDMDDLFNNNLAYPESPQESHAEIPRSCAGDNLISGKKAEPTLEFAKDQPKISPEFGARLQRLRPQQKIRAVVLLEIDRSPQAPARRQTMAERQATIARIRAAAQRSLEEIRPILEAFHASLLAPSPDALGAVPVEIDAAGIPALASSNRVMTILEDQEIRTADGMRSPNRPGYRPGLGYSPPFSR